MPSRKPAVPVAAGTHDDDAGTGDSVDHIAALELAEAEAAEAEANAAAARARAEVLRLRKKPKSAVEAEQATAGDGESEADETADAVEPEAGTEAADGATGVATEDAAVAIEAKPSRRPTVMRVLRWAAAIVAVLAIGALVTTSTLMVIHLREVNAHQQRVAEFEAAARQGVVTVMTLDYNHVDEDVQHIIDNSTGDFKKDFQDASEDFKKTARDSKVITEASVSAAAVESMSDNDAVVLVAAVTKVTNAAGAKQEQRNWRLSVNLTREGDQIKVSKVEFSP